MTKSTVEGSSETHAINAANSVVRMRQTEQVIMECQVVQLLTSGHIACCVHLYVASKWKRPLDGLTRRKEATSRKFGRVADRPTMRIML